MAVLSLRQVFLALFSCGFLRLASIAGVLFLSNPMIAAAKEIDDYEPRGESFSARVLEPDLDGANAKRNTFMDSVIAYCEENSLAISTCLTTIIFLCLFFVAAKIASYIRAKNRAKRDAEPLNPESAHLTLNNMALKKALQNRNNEKQVLKRRLRWYIKYYKHSKVCRNENHELCGDFKDDPNVDDAASDHDFQPKGYLENDVIRRDKKIKLLRFKNIATKVFLDHHLQRLSDCIDQFEKDYMESLTDTGLEPFSMKTYEKRLNDFKVVLTELHEFALKELDDKPHEPKEYSDGEDDETYYSLAPGTT